jgi:hypothetical protein
MQPEILVVTETGDIHAAAVQWGLQRAGYVCRRWFPEAMSRTAFLVNMKSGRVSNDLPGPDGPVDLERVRTVWLRRFGVPESSKVLPPGDRIVARRESENFLRSLLYLPERELTWINSPTAQRIAGLKGRQLRAAQDVSLGIPVTLMTNDAEAARAFIRAAPGRVIYKGFHPATWRSESVCRYLLTTALVSEQDLADPDALRDAPGIFQWFVPKAFELRVSIFGRRCLAAKITARTRSTGGSTTG